MHDRLHPLNDRPVRPDGEYVLYWMIAARRTRFSPALEHAARLARQVQRPLVVLEALGVGAAWSSDRTHAFVIDGMLENAGAVEAGGGVAYPYLERAPGAGRGLIEALAERACAVVTDLYPALGQSRFTRAVAARVAVSMEAVDGNGLLPLSAGAAYPNAQTFRRNLQRLLPETLARPPAADPLTGLPAPTPALRATLATFQHRWPALSARPDLADLPVDHSVAALSLPGGPTAARAALDAFVRRRLDRYGDDRNAPGRNGASGLSPWLHFGHLSAHEVLDAVASHEGWTADRPFPRPNGSREGWWGMRPAAEAFLDEVVTWRELGYQFCHHQPDYDRFETLPEWARITMDRHRTDPRPTWSTPERLEAADTPDPVWNAAQRQLRAEGRIHNYLRMLWGKKILEWSPSPEAAMNTMIELNNRWAIDGRDPNSYSGIAWTLGRFDRPWGPERAVFGTIRYMSSENTLRKLDMGDYLDRWRA